MSEQVAGVFEDHYADKYKKHDPVVKDFEVDAEEAYNKGEVVPSMEPDQTIGLRPEQQETLTRARHEYKRAESGEIDLSGESQYSPEYLKALAGFKAMETPLEKRKLAKEALKETMRLQEEEREIYQWDSIPEGSMLGWTEYVPTDIGKKIAVTSEDALWAGYENASRTVLTAATQAMQLMMPEAGSEYYQAWVDLLNDPQVKTAEIMRPNFMPKIERPEGVGYDLLGGFMQFMPMFLAANARLGNIGALKERYMVRGGLAGIPADFLSFDAADGNLHSALRYLGQQGEITMPSWLGGETFDTSGLDNLYTEYMASEMSDTQLEGRFKNALEGAFIGIIAEYGLVGLSKVWGKIDKQTAAKRFADMTFNTAKALKGMRYSMADSLERRATMNYAKAQEAAAKEAKQVSRGTPAPGSPGSQKGAVGTEGQTSQPGALLPESRQRMIAALSEMALARIVKGDLKLNKPEKWLENIGALKAHPNKKEGRAMLMEAWDNAQQFIKSNGENPLWFSKLERSVLENMSTKVEMTGQQIYASLMGGVKPNGKPIAPTWKYRSVLPRQGVNAKDAVPINPQEVKFSGLEAWLKINKDRVIPKDELVDFIRSHRVKVVVQEHGSNRENVGALRTDRNQYGIRRMESYRNELDDVDEWVNNEMTLTGGDLDEETINMNAWEEAQELVHSTGDYDQRAWRNAAGRGHVNEHMSKWGDEVVSDDLNISRDADGNLYAQDGDELRIQLAGRMMKEINFEDAEVAYEFDNNYDEIKARMVELGYTEREVDSVASEVKEQLEEAKGNLSWIEGDSQSLIRNRMTSEGYELRDSAYEAIIDDVADDIRKRMTRENMQRYELDADDSYYMYLDGDNDWVIHRNGEFIGEYISDNERKRAFRELYAVAVRDGVLESKGPKQPDLATSNQIIKTGWEGADPYSQYTFANISEYAVDEKYNVYTFVWKGDQVKADLDLLRAATSAADEADPELSALIAERELLAKKLERGIRSAHFDQGDYAHVRVTYRREKNSGEAIPHIEEFQSDYLQSFSKKGGKSMTPADAAVLLENQKKIEELIGGRTKELHQNMMEAFSYEKDQFRKSLETQFTYDNFIKIRDELDNAGIGYPTELSNAWYVLDPNSTYDIDTQVQHINYFVDWVALDSTMQNNPEALAYIGKGFGVPDSDKMAQMAKELAEAKRLASMAEKNINPTPFDEKDFQKQLTGVIIKSMLDKGYKKISFPRPWSESGSRNTALAVWREIEVPPYIDEDGVERTTAFLMKMDINDKNGVWRESNLNTRVINDVDHMYSKAMNDNVEAIKGGDDTLSDWTYKIVRNASDVLSEAQLKDLKSGMAVPDTKNMARAIDKMFKGRKGYDSILDYDPNAPKEWYEESNAEYLQYRGYETNYKHKLPKELLKAIQEFDPNAKINTGKQSLLYEREPYGDYRSEDRVFDNRKMPALGDAKGIVENPYLGLTKDEILAKWDMDEEFLRLTDIDLTAVEALTRLKYLPKFGDSVPSSPAALYYVPSEQVRRLFNNKAAAEKLVREYNTYDVEWIDLSGMYDTVDGVPVKKTDGGVSVLGMVPGAAIPAYLLAGGGGEAQAGEKVDIDRELAGEKMPEPEKVKGKKVTE